MPKIPLKPPDKREEQDDNYHKDATNFQDMLDYAIKKEKENENPNRKPYSSFGNNCDTFADRVIRVGRGEEVDEDENRVVDWPWGASVLTFRITYDAKKDKLGGTMYFFGD